jgi:hypothetical protein
VNFCFLCIVEVLVIIESSFGSIEVRVEVEVEVGVGVDVAFEVERLGLPRVVLVRGTSS